MLMGDRAVVEVGMGAEGGREYQAMRRQSPEQEMWFPVLPSLYLLKIFLADSAYL